MDDELKMTPTNPWEYDEILSLKQKNFLNCLKSSLCIVSTAMDLYRDWVKDTGQPSMLSKATHYAWLDNDERYRTYYLDLKSDVKDFGESCLHRAMKGHKHRKTITRTTKDGEKIVEVEEWEAPGDKTCIIFFNKTQNKDRGYVERQELTTPEGIRIEMMAPIILNVKESTQDPENERR